MAYRHLSNAPCRRCRCHLAVAADADDSIAVIPCEEEIYLNNYNPTPNPEASRIAQIDNLDVHSPIRLRNYDPEVHVANANGPYGLIQREEENRPINLNEIAQNRHNRRLNGNPIPNFEASRIAQIDNSNVRSPITLLNSDDEVPVRNQVARYYILPQPLPLPFWNPQPYASDYGRTVITDEHREQLTIWMRELPDHLVRTVIRYVQVAQYEKHKAIWSLRTHLEDELDFYVVDNITIIKIFDYLRLTNERPPMARLMSRVMEKAAKKYGIKQFDDIRGLMNIREGYFVVLPNDVNSDLDSDSSDSVVSYSDPISRPYTPIMSPCASIRNSTQDSDSDDSVFLHDEIDNCFVF